MDIFKYLLLFLDSIPLTTLLYVNLLYLYSYGEFYSDYSADDLLLSDLLLSDLLLSDLLLSDLLLSDLLLSD
ncbi:hypothetical protein CMK18_05220, partial [Candidatus Poribacteria bacterium]|nr:hypothetical protein [Candidatus Poribacteria bacterium]